MKLKRAPHLNEYSDGLKGTSRGAYRVKGTPFLVLKEYNQGGYWSILPGELHVPLREWMKRQGLWETEFSTRAQALDALQMALAEDPILDKSDSVKI